MESEIQICRMNFYNKSYYPKILFKVIALNNIEFIDLLLILDFVKSIRKELLIYGKAREELCS